MLMLGRHGHHVAGIGVIHRVLIGLHLVMLMRGDMLRLRTVMEMSGTRRSGLVHKAGRGIAERQRHARREHAKQVEQGGEPPRFDTRRSRQADEHDGKVGPTDDSAKAMQGRCPPQLHA